MRSQPLPSRRHSAIKDSKHSSSQLMTFLSLSLIHWFFFLSTEWRRKRTATAASSSPRNIPTSFSTKNVSSFSKKLFFFFVKGLRCGGGGRGIAFDCVGTDSSRPCFILDENPQGRRRDQMGDCLEFDINITVRQPQLACNDDVHGPPKRLRRARKLHSKHFGLLSSERETCEEK